MLQPDGSWRLNGEKRFIGNGSRAGVIVTFARAEVNGKDSHIALILEKGMKGLEPGERYDTMGLAGNDLRHLYFRDIRVPPENVLGEPGDGFKLAMQILNNGRLSLGTGCVGAAKQFLDLAIAHVTERHQFGRALADFELVQEKIGWMVSFLFGLESMAYLTTGLVDAGVKDYSIESAMCKVSGTEFLWYQANRALQLAGGEGYLRQHPLRARAAQHSDLPHLRGGQRRAPVVHRAVGSEAAGRGAEGAGPAGSVGPDPLARRAGRVRRRPDRPRGPSRPPFARPFRAARSGRSGDRPGQAARGVSEGVLRRHGRDIIEREFVHKRLADAAADIYAQVAVLSRVTSIFDEQDPELSGQERYIAETFCTRAAHRVRANLRMVEDNDDDRMTALAKLAYKRGSYGYALFED